MRGLLESLGLTTATESWISFPGLGIKEPFLIDGVAFVMPGIDREIRWYALLITLGIICCLTYIVVQSRKIGVTMDDIIDGALFVIPIGILGARLYYVIFDTNHTYTSLRDVLDMTQGGLAIYGGIIAGALTVIGYTVYKRINFFSLGDAVAPAVLMAQGIGRWGNFMNGEAFGGETDFFLKMGVCNVNTSYTFGTTEMVFVHPTFLYESLWNLLGVLLIYLFMKFIHKKYDGQLILLTFGWYGLGRMFIEGLRTDSLYIGSTDIRVSQLLAGILFGVCLVLLIVLAIRKPKTGFYFKYPLPEGVKGPKFNLKENLKAAFYTERTAENEKPIDYKPILEQAKLAKAEAAKAKKEAKKQKENKE